MILIFLMNKFMVLEIGDLPMLDAVSYNYSHSSVKAHVKTIACTIDKCIKNGEKKDNL